MLAESQKPKEKYKNEAAPAKAHGNTATAKDDGKKEASPKNNKGGHKNSPAIKGGASSKKYTRQMKRKRGGKAHPNKKAKALNAAAAKKAPMEVSKEAAEPEKQVLRI